MPGVVESPRVNNEPYQTWGRQSTNPEMERLQGLAGGFGDQYQGALGQQQTAYNAYGQMAAGQGPSLAENQLHQGLAAANRAAQQQAMQARGGNAAGAQAAGLQAMSSLGGQAAMGAAQLRQQEQLAAMQAQAAMANQMAGQGLQAQMGLEGMYQQGLGAQFAGDIDYRLQSRAIREQERAGRGQRIQNAIKATPLGWFGSDERIKTNIQPGAEATSDALRYVPQDPYAGYQHPQLGKVGAMLGGGQGGGGGGGGGGLNIGSIIGLAGLLSDERTKRNIQPGNLSASQAVGELDPYTFEYEAGYGDGPGQRIGIMAQDLEKVAPQAVADTPAGKMVNTAQGTGLALAHGAELEQRMRGLEQRLGVDTTDALRQADAAHEARARQKDSRPPPDDYQRMAYMQGRGPIPHEDTRASGAAATQQQFSAASGQARQMDADAAALRAKQGRPTSDEARRMAMSVGAVPQQREFGPNSLQEIDRNYGYEGPVSTGFASSYEASPASAASSAMARINAIEKGLAAQASRDPNWRFTQPQAPVQAATQPGFSGLAAMQPMAQAGNPTQDVYDLRGVTAPVQVARGYGPQGNMYTGYDGRYG